MKPHDIAQKQTKPPSFLRKAISMIVGLAGLAVAGVLVIFAIFMFSRPSPPKVSNDIAELRNTINVDIPIAAVKWQIFRWPEDSFMATPDVFTLLVAEIELSDPAWFKPDGNLENGWDPHDAARSWLSEPFKSLMKKTASDRNALTAAGCGRFESSLKSSGRPVRGFICPAQGKVLVYLTLDAPT